MWFFAPFEYESLWDMINLRDGGLAIYGGVLAAFVSALFLCRWRRCPRFPCSDLAAMGFLIGQGLGRWGNFFNQEAFGTNTTPALGHVQRRNARTILHRCRQRWRHRA